MRQFELLPVGDQAKLDQLSLSFKCPILAYRQTTQALMLAVMIIEVKPGAKPAKTVA